MDKSQILLNIAERIQSEKLYVKDVDAFSIPEFGPRNTAITRNAAISAITDNWHCGV